MKNENEKQQEVKSVPTNLTMLQRIALEGEVCACFETAFHKEEKIYFAYVLLKCTPEEYYPFFVEEMLKYIDQEDLDRIQVYLINDMFPISLWVNKVIADIEVYTNRYKGEISENKMPPKFPEPIIKSKFVSYINVVCKYLPSIIKELLYTITSSDNENIEFLKSTAFSLLPKLEDKKDFTNDTYKIIPILQPSIAESKMCSFIQETDKLDETENSLTKNALKDLVDSVIASQTPNKVYRVTKIDKVTKQVAFTKDFPTQAKALEYLKAIGKDYPELKERYDFVIVTDTQD